jgi:hypothetical protein
MHSIVLKIAKVSEVISGPPRNSFTVASIANSIPRSAGQRLLLELTKAPMTMPLGSQTSDAPPSL